MARVLLHVCCGPCSIHPVERLREQGHEVTGVYYNPNIHPLTEYLRRREALVETAARLDYPVLFLDAEYQPEQFFRAVCGRENERCGECYALRLARTRAMAEEQGYDLFTTTLLYSKFQRHELIAQTGAGLAAPGGPGFLYQDFREGWKRGVAQSKEWGIYRQQYCGCLYSEFERYERDLQRCIDPGA